MRAKRLRPTLNWKLKPLLSQIKNRATNSACYFRNSWLFMLRAQVLLRFPHLFRFGSYLLGKCSANVVNVLRKLWESWRNCSEIVGEIVDNCRVSVEKVLGKCLANVEKVLRKHYESVEKCCFTRKIFKYLSSIFSLSPLSG